MRFHQQKVNSFIKHLFKYASPIGVIVLFISSTAFKQRDSITENSLFNPGVVFEIEVKDHEQSPPRTEEMEVVVEGRNLAIPVSSSDGQRGKGKMIFRGDRGDNGEVVVVDDDKQTYYVMDDATIRNMGGMLGETMTNMDSAVEQAIKNLPKEQQEAIRKAQQQAISSDESAMSGSMGGATGGAMKPRTKPEVKRTGERGEKQGYPCVKYEVFQDGRKIREIWTTDWDNIDGGDEAEEAFRGMGAFFDALWDALPPMPGGEDAFGGQDPYDEMNFENGFPVVTKGYGEDGGLEDESWLRRTRRERIDPSAFEPPSGYKRMSMGPR